jgi:NAD(P)-dependent dehydrogenase (short-subunit alcohol dehydrogenase family)
VATQFAGKVALVTGGGSGIGRASALAFAKKGAKVVIADVAVEGGQDTMYMIKDINGEAIFIKTDISKALEVKTLIKKTIDTYGVLNFAFNNAGIEGKSSSTVACTEENWDRVMNINLKGVWLCMKYQIPYMREQGGGVIVNMSSIAGISSCLQRFPAYVASKHAVIGLTKVAAAEYAKAGIRINALCPGFIHTPMSESKIQDTEVHEWINNQVPVGRLGTPEEIAEIAVWLCSDTASYITGHAMLVDGGLLVQSKA